jgi:DNA replication and repair protein RecF
MSLALLRLGDFRALRAAELALHPRLNLVTGANGSGKTTLLEAIYLLGRGRSFRNRHAEQLIRHGQRRFWLHGRTGPGPGHVIGIGCDRDAGLEVRIDERAATSLAELSDVFPVQIIDPGIHRLVEDGPTQRRRWLDWAVFHVEPQFVSSWQGYTRALKQRNAALKAGTDPKLWEHELIRLGALLTGARRRVLEQLQAPWRAALSELDAVEASLAFFQGWSQERSLEEALAAQLPKDRERGITSVGPHRFEIVLRVAARPAREIVSRGQQKILGAAMALSMARYVAAVAGRPSTLLLDDPAAELDAGHTRRLLAAVAQLGGQLVVTALHPQDTALGLPDAVFHVEHGAVNRV